MSRARYCAQCGLNLATAGASEITRTLRRNNRNVGTGLILFGILLALFMVAMTLFFRVTRCPRSVPRRIVTPYHYELKDHWQHSQTGEQITQRWHAEWKTER